MYQRNHRKMRFIIAVFAVITAMLPMCVFAGEAEMASYTVQHWTVDQNDVATLVVAEVDHMGAVGTDVVATPKSMDGYIYAEDYPGAVPSGRLSSDEALTLKLYYRIDLDAAAAADEAVIVPKVPEPAADDVVIVDGDPPLAAPSEEIAGFTPVAGFSGHTTWALYNLILTAVTVLIMVGVFVTSPFKRLWLRAVSAIVMFSAVGLFLITENMMERMILVDEYTVMHIVLAGASGVIAFLAWNVFRLPEPSEVNTDGTV